MSDAKARVSGSITLAKVALERALADLADVQPSDAGITPFFAHALRNFLTVSLATIDLLRDAVGPRPKGDVGVLLDGLEHSTLLMMGAVARLQGDQVEVPFRAVRVLMPVLLQRAANYYEPTAAAKRVSIALELDPQVTYAWTDGVAVAAVLDNLLSNAVKFSPAEARVTLGLRLDDEHLVCEVRDEGPGLSAGDQAGLFTQPGTLTPRPTAGEPSHGHGLAVAATLVARLHGTIGCDSALRQGSTFWFRLPLGRPEATTT